MGKLLSARKKVLEDVGLQYEYNPANSTKRGHMFDVAFNKSQWVCLNCKDEPFFSSFTLFDEHLLEKHGCHISNLVKLQIQNDSFI